MANQTISGLNTLTTPSSNALLWVYDVNATPGDRSLTLPNLKTWLDSRLNTWILDSISGGKTYSSFARDTRIVESASGTIDITAGATVAGIRVDIVNKYAAGITLAVTTGAANVTMLLGSLSFEWDGTQWHKIGGMALVVVFTSGTGATWKAPWAGSYSITGVGGGAGGGGYTTLAGGATGAGGGGAGGGVVKNYFCVAGTTFTYTIGGSGTPGSGASSTAGGNGGNTTVTDGTTLITGAGGNGGGTCSTDASSPVGGLGGSSSGGDVNLSGGDGGSGKRDTTSQVNSANGGNGGNSIFGGGGRGGYGGLGATGLAGQVGKSYGSGGGGQASWGANVLDGGAGVGGVVIINF